MKIGRYLGYDCAGGKDGDCLWHSRPFKHKSVSRSNWRRRFSKFNRLRGKKDLRRRLEEAK